MSYVIVRVNKVFHKPTGKYIEQVTGCVGQRKNKLEAQERAEELTKQIPDLHTKLAMITNKPSEDRTQEENDFTELYYSAELNKTVKYVVWQVKFA